MSPMEAFRTPHQGIVQILSTIFWFYECTILFQFLRIAVIDSDRKETDGTLRQHVHAIKTKHDLTSHVLRKIVVTLHAQLVLFEVVGYTFGDR